MKPASGVLLLLVYSLSAEEKLYDVPEVTADGLLDEPEIRVLESSYPRMLSGYNDGDQAGSGGGGGPSGNNAQSTTSCSCHNTAIWVTAGISLLVLFFACWYVKKL